MKRYLFAIALGIPLSVPAQPAQEGVDMQKVMQAVQQMEQCMKSVDEAALEKLGEEGKKFQQEVEKLCKAGKRDEAQDLALDFGREMAGNAELQKMRKCTEIVAKVMPQMAPQLDLLTVEELKERHICDETE